MDWKLTKSIYLIVFLLINVVLIIVLFNKNQGNEAENIPHNKNIKESNIDTSQLDPYDPVELTVLNGKQHTFSSETDRKNNEDTSLLNIKESEDLSFDTTIIKKYMNENIYHGDEYIYDSNSSNDDIIYFNQTYNSLPIFNNKVARVKVTGEDGKVTNLEQGYITDITKNEYSKKVTVRNPIDLVEELYQDERISNDAVIEKATLGYYVVTLEEDTNQVLLRPKWQLAINDQDTTHVIYMDALNASEEIIESE